MADVTVELHPGAIDDIDNGRGWYDRHNPVVADAFIAEVDYAMFLIAESPDRWPKRYGQVRAYVLPGFPYTVFYSCKDDVVLVLAVASDYRRPGYWNQRR